MGKIKPLSEVKAEDRCKLHTIHSPTGDVIKINICENVSFYSDDATSFDVSGESDVQKLGNFFSDLISVYKAKFISLDEKAEEYDSKSTEYSNDLIHALFKLLNSSKKARKYSIELHAELSKIAKEFNSVELSDCLVDALELKDEFEVLSEMIADTVEMVSHLNENDTNNMMKKLTTYTVIFTPLNLLAGMGGMSEWSSFVAFAKLGGFWGYLLFAAILLAVALGTAYYLKKK